MLDRAKKYLLQVLDTLGPQLQARTPIVVLEPSCASVFRDDAQNLLANDPRVEQLARQTYLLSEFLAHHAPDYHPPVRNGQHIVLHGHCHQKLYMREEIQLLQSTGAHVKVLDSGCCGMAGPFGFEKDKYEISKTLANRVLIPAVQGAPGDSIIVTNGFSCREQISQLTGRDAVHLSQILARK